MLSALVMDGLFSASLCSGGIVLNGSPPVSLYPLPLDPWSTVTGDDELDPIGMEFGESVAVTDDSNPIGVYFENA